MLTNRYLPSTKNLSAIMGKIVEGTAPEKFTNEHLKGIGFSSSNDRAIIPLLKDLGFLSPNGAPTQRYHDYRDPSRSRKIMGQALKETYSDLFHINEKPTAADRKAIEGKFKTVHNVKDKVASLQALTFLTLLNLADLDGSDDNYSYIADDSQEQAKLTDHQSKSGTDSLEPPANAQNFLNLRYNIEVHLPATKDVEVYNAIFKALREHLGE